MTIVATVISIGVGALAGVKTAEILSGVTKKLVERFEKKEG